MERNIDKDPHSALLSMHAGINDLLKIHYRFNEKWWISDKRILQDLSEWDKSFADILKEFLIKSEIKEKFKIWSQIVDYISSQMGEKITVCDCNNCKLDLQNLLENT